MKRYTLLVLFIILILISFIYLSYTSYEQFQVNPKPDYDIIVITGQSNACGAGTRNDHTDKLGPIYTPEYDGTNNKIKMFKRNNKEIVEARDPIEHIEDRTWVGPSNSFALSFAKEYLVNNPTKNVLIIGCGYGATGVYSGRDGYYWKKPKESDNQSKSLYKKTIDRVTAAKEYIGNNSKIVALCWQGGENDATKTMGRDKISVLSDLAESLNGMRTSIMNQYNQTYRFPVLVGGFPNRGDTIPLDLYKDVVTQIPKSKFVITSAIRPPTASYDFNHNLETDNGKDSKGQERTNKGTAHFSASSNRELGKRYFYFYNMIK